MHEIEECRVPRVGFELGEIMQASARILNSAMFCTAYVKRTSCEKGLG